MDVPASITKAYDLVMWIEALLHEVSLPATDRARIAAGCFAAALEHHHAIVVLSRERLAGSAFALMRIEYEAYVRGIWLARCATEAQLADFLRGNEPPKLGVMLEQIEVVPPFADKTLSDTKTAGWSTMCSYTHTRRAPSATFQYQRSNPIPPYASGSRRGPSIYERVCLACGTWSSNAC